MIAIIGKLRMAVPTQMKQIAIGVANHLQMRAHEAKQELFTTKMRKAEIEVQLEQAELAYNRAIGFQSQIGGILQCPRCWVADETRSTLTPVEGDTNSEDTFECQICGIKISLQQTG